MCQSVLFPRFFLPTKTWDWEHSRSNFSQALGDETDFSKPDAIRVIEKFLVDCSEAVSKRWEFFVSADNDGKPFLKSLWR